MESTKFKELLKNLNACNDAKEWASGKPWETIYTTCHRGDWLLWLFRRVNPKDKRALSLAKGHCAETVKHLMKDKRSIAAVEAAIDFGNNLITENELAASYAAAAAAYASYAAASYAAAAAADAAYAAADAAYAAAAAAYAAADAAVGDADAAYAANRQQTADICRKYLPIEIWNIK